MGRKGLDGWLASARVRLLSLLALALILAPTALAAETAPVLLEWLDEERVVADVDTPGVANLRLFNLNPQDDFYVSVTADAPSGWKFSAEPTGFFLGPRNTSDIAVSFRPLDVPLVSSLDIEVTVSLVNGRTGEVTHLREEIEVFSGAAPRVLGLFANPLGAPLDNAYGTFLLSMVFWIASALVAMFLGNTIVRLMTSRASNTTTREIIHKLQRPVFLFVLFLGLASSFAVLPRNVLVDFLARSLVAIAVLVYGLYVLYRLLDAALTYYQRELAPRTETNVDDVLVPVIRKVGLVVIYVVGAILTLRNLGWDPTILFAGAGIAGLVIAFAAQDTISNLFSGVFIMLDQPFKEGDDIRLESGDVARVQEIGLRTTKLYIGRNHEIVVMPNNQLATTRVVNLTGPDQRYWVMVNIGVSYNSEPEAIRATLLEIARDDPRVLHDVEGFAPVVIFGGFGDSSLDFVLRCATADYRERFLLASDLRFRIFKTFEERGIEIPFPQRVVHVRGEGPPALLSPPGPSEP